MRGSFFADRLGLHVHVTMRGGALGSVRLAAHPHPGEASADPELLEVMERIAEHCSTGRGPLADIPVALDELGVFDRHVLETLAREVPAGRIVSYAELAELAGRNAGAARAVGAAMARNPVPIVVPCHRVVPRGGRIGNYSGEGGWATKMKLLDIEGAARGLRGEDARDAPSQTRLPLG